MNTDMLMMNPMPMLLVKLIFLMECKNQGGINQCQEGWKPRLLKSSLSCGSGMKKRVRSKGRFKDEVQQR